MFEGPQREESNYVLGCEGCKPTTLNILQLSIPHSFMGEHPLQPFLWEQHEEESVGKTDNESGPRRIPDCALLPTMGTDPETTIITMFKERKAKLEN